MTSRELHEQKIVPLRFELQRLEDEWEELYRAECGEKVRGMASCGNCAFSCVEAIGDHNECMARSCTCCRDWCVKWKPENEISAFLRKHYPYNSLMYLRLEQLFGHNFIVECTEPHKKELVTRALTLIAEFDDKHARLPIDSED